MFVHQRALDNNHNHRTVCSHARILSRVVLCSPSTNTESTFSVHYSKKRIEHLVARARWCNMQL